MEEIRGYGKVRRIKYGASMGIYGDNDDTCESMKKYEKLRRLRTRWYRRWMDPARGKI